MKDQMKTSEGRQAVFLRLYQQCFPDLAKYIQKRGGSLEDAQDIFQDSLVIYYEQLVAGKEIQQESAYLFSVAKYLWFKRYKSQQAEWAMDDLEAIEEVEEYAIAEESSTFQLIPFLQQAGKKCMQMLKSFYYDRLSMEELAGQFGYSSTRSATVQKYKCLEKVRDQVKEKALTYEDFVK
ncbi:RNA polymerase sigma factor [Echinicola shivajiensis]|uniref:RNA polymerase sigma factor n=1 Tax=Echinicola shivajiensis TaxID=1035916 RepID=UPI001BFC001F|nr:sigma-70 family RNA polymerase sigma factor [Echinicola shivajiensis]